MHSAALADASQSLLLIIDVQTRLAAAMPEAVRQQQLENTVRLCKAATTLQIPLLHTEQYPQGLGPSDASLQACFTLPAIEKPAFPAVRLKAFCRHLKNTSARRSFSAAWKLMSVYCKRHLNCRKKIIRCLCSKTRLHPGTSIIIAMHFCACGRLASLSAIPSQYCLNG